MGRATHRRTLKYGTNSRGEGGGRPVESVKPQMAVMISMDWPLALKLRLTHPPLPTKPFTKKSIQRNLKKHFWLSLVQVTKLRSVQRK